ncbi:hypothetical protein GCM10023149_48930 [Mucilaginibacter gynuensis]|uniref:Uncharacterized protein n=1 Tax=Mucilaginibacter gynuensis TaxID=1302236 RepID=A0ABP8HFP2_9SPHI
MHIVHSNINPQKPEPVKVEKPKPLTRQQQFAREMAYAGFKRACKKYAKEIAEVQEYFPGWMPQFE